MFEFYDIKEALPDEYSNPIIFGGWGGEYGCDALFKCSPEHFKDNLVVFFFNSPQLVELNEGVQEKVGSGFDFMFSGKNCYESEQKMKQFNWSENLKWERMDLEYSLERVGFNDFEYDMIYAEKDKLDADEDFWNSIPPKGTFADKSYMAFRFNPDSVRENALCRKNGGKGYEYCIAFYCTGEFELTVVSFEERCHYCRKIYWNRFCCS